MVTALIKLLDLVATSIYLFIAVFSFIGCFLYLKAYREMKRTRIIGSVAMLMGCIAVDSCAWFVSEFLRFTSHEHDYIPWTVHPLMLITIKLFMLAGVFLFVRASTQEDRVITLNGCEVKNGRDKLH